MLPHPDVTTADSELQAQDPRHQVGRLPDPRILDQLMCVCLKKTGKMQYICVHGSLFSSLSA